MTWGIVFFSLVLMSSCEGPVGPPGPPGPDGLDGQVIVGEVFEIVGNFTEEGNYGIAGEYGFEIFETDKLLVYHLDGLLDGDVDLWRPLPRTVFLEGGNIFNYSFDFTFFDYSIFLEGNFALGLLGSEWTEDQVFRIFIIPGDFINARMDFSDQSKLLEMMEVKESEIQRIRLN